MENQGLLFAEAEIFAEIVGSMGKVMVENLVESVNNFS